jgi:hypothetical protein
MTDPEQDDVFEAYLKRRAVLPALDDKAEPPAALDAAVLAEARAAIQPAGADRSPAIANEAIDAAAAAPRRAAPVADTDASRAGSGTPGGLTKSPVGRPARWAVPVALAATLLLCLSVVMNISLNTNRPSSSPNRERMAAARADSKASALANATAESNAAAGVAAPGAGAAHDRFADNGERPQSVSGEMASREVVLPRAKVAGVPAPRAPIVAESAAAPNASSADAAAASPPMLTASAAPRAQATGGQPAAGDGSLARRAAQSTADAPRMSAEDKAVMMAKRAGIAAQQNSPAPAASRDIGQAMAMRGAAAVAPAAPAAAKPEAAVAGHEGTDQHSAVAARQGAATPAAAAAPHPADPKVWLQQINALRAVGKTDQADAQMRRFKAAFPDYAIPAAVPVPAAPDLPK